MSVADAPGGLRRGELSAAALPRTATTDEHHQGRHALPLVLPLRHGGLERAHAPLRVPA
jgi:hypothetical protein